MGHAIELKSVSKKYSLKNGQLFKAVDDLSIQIPRGQVIGFLGPNGAGKTTTIKMICNLITPTSGTISLNGFDVNKNRRDAMKQIGVVLEGTRNIFWQLSSWQNLIYFGQLKGISGKELHNRAERLLKDLELWKQKDELVVGFSRGMQQKVAIACALIANPPIILLDEPTLGLDVQASRTIKSWIEDLAQKEQKTIVLTTHQLDIAEQLCERMVIINKGKIISDKPTEELLRFFHEEQYHISIAGKYQNNILPGMKITEKENETIFSGPIINQKELHQKLQIIQKHSLPLLSVTRTKHNLEDIFMHLTQKQDTL